MPLIPADLLYHAPSGHRFVPGLRLQVVPQPRNSWRDIIGRWLIRTGQRMIFQSRLG
jgi:hypothetical protein